VVVPESAPVRAALLGVAGSETAPVAGACAGIGADCGAIDVVRAIGWLPVAGVLVGAGAGAGAGVDGADVDVGVDVDVDVDGVSDAGRW
jgi:hypothetical protein